MAIDTQTRYIFDAHGVTNPVGSIGAASVYHNSRWNFAGPRTIYFYSLTYILVGKCRYTEPTGKDVILQPGDLFFCFPGIPHRIDPLPGEQFSEFWITFIGPIFDMWREEKLLHPDRFSMHLQPVEYWLGRFEALFANARTDLYGQIMLVGGLQNLIGEAMSLQPNIPNDPDQEWLAQAKALVEAELRIDRLDLEQVAATMGMSYASFRRKFVTLAGVPPGRYHTKVTMQRACQWMHTSRAANKELAEWCGFCNEHHFSKRFKEVLGMSPRECRAQMEGGRGSLPKPGSSVIKSSWEGGEQFAPETA